MSGFTSLRILKVTRVRSYFVHVPGFCPDRSSPAAHDVRHTPPRPLYFFFRFYPSLVARAFSLINRHRIIVSRDSFLYGGEKKLFNQKPVIKRSGDRAHCIVFIQMTRAAERFLPQAPIVHNIIINVTIYLVENKKKIFLKTARLTAVVGIQKKL